MEQSQQNGDGGPLAGDALASAGDVVTLGQNETPGQQEVEDNLLLLRTTLYNKENEAAMMHSLRVTRSRRMEMAKDADIDLLTVFPFFFTHPEMVYLSFFDQIKY